MIYQTGMLMTLDTHPCGMRFLLDSDMKMKVEDLLRFRIAMDTGGLLHILAIWHTLPNLQKEELSWIENGRKKQWVTQFVA